MWASARRTSGLGWSGPGSQPVVYPHRRLDVGHDRDRDRSQPVSDPPCQEPWGYELLGNVTPNRGRHLNEAELTMIARPVIEPLVHDKLSGRREMVPLLGSGSDTHDADAAWFPYIKSRGLPDAGACR